MSITDLATYRTQRRSRAAAAPSVGLPVVSQPRWLDMAAFHAPGSVPYQHVAIVDAHEGGRSADGGDQVSRLVAEFLAGHRGNTLLAYRRDLIDYLQWCARVEVDPLRASRADVANYLQRLEDDGLAAATRARRLATVRGLYRVAVEDGVCALSPAARHRVRGSSARRLIHALSREQLRALLLSAERGDDARLRGLVWLLAGTGLRISEACHARVEHLEPDSSGHLWLTVTAKGDLLRSVPLHSQVLLRLQPLHQDRLAGPLFVTRGGRPLDRTNAARQVKNLARQAGLPSWVGPHTLRHTFVTLARQAGCGLEDVQDAVGHAHVETTRRYDRTAVAGQHHPAPQILPRLP